MSAESFRGLAGWSGNSNAFAYWDADGLKWLDMSTMQVPSLILQYEDIPSLAHLNSVGSIPPLLELSNTGRYIRYGEVDEWILLDTLTGSEYDDVLVSPGETEFIAIAPEVSPYQYRNQAEEGECLMFDLDGNCLIRRGRYGEMCVAPMVACATPVSLHDFQLRKFYWYDNSNAIYFACESSENNLCFVRQAPLEQIYSSQAPASYQTNAFAYDEYYGHIAWAVDDYYLRLDAYVYGTAVDFSAVLDSPIVSLEWGRPMWYLGE